MLAFGKPIRRAGQIVLSAILEDENVLPCFINEPGNLVLPAELFFERLSSENVELSEYVEVYRPYNA